MFLNFIKNYILKKALKNSLRNVVPSGIESSIQTVGLIIDESFFFEKEILIKVLIENGISGKNIKIVAYRDRFKKNEVYPQTTFGIKDFNWKAEIIKPEVTEFVSTNFDLLVSYYDDDNAALKLVTNNSKADFKVGFASVDKRLNHLMINTDLQNHKVFTQELFRYLKILNKI